MTGWISSVDKKLRFGIKHVQSKVELESRYSVACIPTYADADAT